MTKTNNKALVSTKNVNEEPVKSTNFEIPLTAAVGGVKVSKDAKGDEVYDDKREFKLFKNGDELGAFLADFYRKKYEVARGRTHIMDANKGLVKISTQPVALYFAKDGNPKQLMQGSNTMVLPSFPKFVNGKMIRYEGEERAMTADLHREICVKRANEIWLDISGKFGVVPVEDSIFGEEMEEAPEAEAK